MDGIIALKAGRNQFDLHGEAVGIGAVFHQDLETFSKGYVALSKDGGTDFEMEWVGGGYGSYSVIFEMGSDNIGGSGAVGREWLLSNEIDISGIEEDAEVGHLFTEGDEVRTVVVAVVFDSERGAELVACPGEWRQH